MGHPGDAGATELFDVGKPPIGTGVRIVGWELPPEYSGSKVPFPLRSSS